MKDESKVPNLVYRGGDPIFGHMGWGSSFSYLVREETREYPEVVHVPFVVLGLPYS